MMKMTIQRLFAVLALLALSALGACGGGGGGAGTAPFGPGGGGGTGGGGTAPAFSVAVSLSNQTVTAAQPATVSARASPQLAAPL